MSGPRSDRRMTVGVSLTLAAIVAVGASTLAWRLASPRISGPDVEAGAQVRVIAADGATLKVERA